ncbi:hypothetical protein Tco_0995872 [Tanacetum coccineum]
MLAQVVNQGNVGNQIGDVVNENKKESMQDMSGCSVDQKVKYTADSFVEEFFPSHEMQKLETMLWNHAMVRAGHAAYTDRFHKLARLVRHLTDEAMRNRSIKKVEKRGNVGEPSKDKNGRDDNKRTRTQNAFSTTANLDYRGVPRNVNHVNASNLTVKACYECGSTDHVRSSYPRLNCAQGQEENHPNQVVANNGGQGHGNQGNQASFVFTTLTPLLGLEPSQLGFKYEIEIVSGQLVKIDKVIKGMDWLSNYKEEIICHKKAVRIPLLDGKVLRVLGERSEEKVRLLMGAKAGDKKQEENVVVRDFPELFLDDLYGLLPIQ